MNEWLVAALVLGACILPCLAVCVFASASAALAAVELASTLTVTALMALTEGFHRQPFIDLALILALVSLVGALAFARMMEAHL